MNLVYLPNARNNDHPVSARRPSGKASEIPIPVAGNGFGNRIGNGRNAAHNEGGWRRNGTGEIVTGEYHEHHGRDKRKRNSPMSGIWHAVTEHDKKNSVRQA